MSMYLWLFNHVDKSFIYTRLIFWLALFPSVKAFQLIESIRPKNERVSTLLHQLNALSLILVKLAGKTKDVKFPQRLNAPKPILVKPSGKETDFKLVQQLNEWLSTLVKPSGKEMESKPLHPENADSPILVKLLGNTMEDKDSLFWNAYSLMLSTSK